jgi:hypothetical protein
LTESRYIVVILGVWLAVVILQFLRARPGAIIFVPMSLALMAGLSTFGPWGAFAVSARSQTLRLEEMLTRNGLLVQGNLRVAPAQPPFDDAKEICSVLRYLVNVHGIGGLEPLFGRDFDSAGDSIGSATRSQQPRMLASLLGVSYVEEWQSMDDGEVSFYGLRGGVVPVSGFSVLVRGMDFFGENTSAGRTTFSASGMSYRAWLLKDSSRVMIRRLSTDSGTVVIDLHPAILERNERRSSPGQHGEEGLLSVAGSGAGMNALLLVQDLQGKRVDAGWAIRVLRGDLLLTDSTRLGGR